MKQSPRTATYDSFDGNVSNAPTKSFSKNTATGMASGAIQAGTQVLGGALQAGAMDTAGATAQTDSLEALDQIEIDARIDRATQKKADALQAEQDTYRRMDDNIGLGIQKFQRSFQDRLRQLEKGQKFANKIKGLGDRNNQIEDVQIQQAGDR